jgi:Mor family transcriptional regulator
MTTNEKILARLPGNLRRIAELVGIENALKISDEFGGLELFIPKGDDFRRAVRDADIRAAYDGGIKVRILARRYSLTERQIYNILGVQPEEELSLPFDLA